jgi:hypothetical protein
MKTTTGHPYRFALLSLPLLLLTAAPLFGVDAVVQQTRGKVEVREQGGSWQPAERGMRISRGTFISTGFDSEAVLELGGATLEVSELTRMQLERLVEEKETVSTELFLKVGKVKAEVRDTEGLRNDFELRGPVSTAAVRGTSFIFDGYTLWVEEGTVIFENLIGQRRQVRAGGRSGTGGYGPPSGTEESSYGEQFAVDSKVSGAGGLVAAGDGTEGIGAIAVLTIEWE